MYLYDYINDVTHIVILLRQHVQTYCLPEIQCCDIFFGRALLSYVKRCMLNAIKILLITYVIRLLTDSHQME